MNPVQQLNHHKVQSSLVTPLRNVLCETLVLFATMHPKMPWNSVMEVLGCHWWRAGKVTWPVDQAVTVSIF